jgi:very-short-patch-repair endonuclease
MRNKMIPYARHLKPFARKLRQQGILSEVILWKQLKNKALGVEFHRQVPIDEYVVDFYCHELKLAVEIDGASHKEERVAKKDLERQEWLQSLGVRFLRFDDAQVRFDTMRIMISIQATVDEWLR